MKIRFTYYLSLLTLCLLISCAGGGTSGTGLPSLRILSGTVNQSEGEPLTNALVTIQETGESDLTDANGEFQIDTDLIIDTYNLLIEKEDVDTTVTVATSSEQTQNLQVDISLAETTSTLAALSTLEVWAKVVGACDAFFENHPRIRQSVAVRGNLNCTLKFYASGDFQRLDRVPATIEVSNCDGLKWKTIATGSTGSGNRSGVGQIPFTFIDDAEHCLYRFKAPVGLSDVKPVEVFIDTFTYQDLKASEE